MNIQNLRYIVQVDRMNSISEAAKVLYVSQPTLSRAIRELENETGLILFQRTNKGVSTTHDGKNFIERIKKLLQDIDQIESQYFNTNMPASDEFTLLVASQRATQVVDTFSKFYQKYCTEKNNLNLVLREGNRDDVTKSVFNHSSNIGIVHYMSSEENQFLKTCSAMFLSCHLLRDGLVYVQLRKGHPLSTKREISLDMLKPYPRVAFADEDLTGINYCSDVFQFNRHILDKRIVVQDRGTLRHIIQGTDGYYFGNAQCGGPFQSGTNYIPLKDYPYTIRTIYIYRHDSNLGAADKLFIELLEEAYQKEDFFPTSAV